MGSWRKLLRQMMADSKPVGYSYDDAVRILTHLDFTLAPSSHGGSHRVWRRARGDGTFVRIGLVDYGHGCLKRAYIDDMLSILRSEGLLPTNQPED